MSTALALVDNNHSSTYTDAENLARHIISRMESVSAKLRSLEDDIRKLWAEFDKLKAGETILGCATKKEFCERKLQRTPRTIQYLLAGQSNPADRPHSELSSPVASVQIGGRLIVVGDLIPVRRGRTVALEKVVSVTGGRCDPAKYPIVVTNKTFDKNHFNLSGHSYSHGDDDYDAKIVFGEQCSPPMIPAVASKPVEHCTITPKNIEDTRCLSMAQYRLHYCGEKVKLLLAMNDKKARKVLVTYQTAFREFAAFAVEGEKRIAEHLGKTQRKRRKARPVL